MVSGSAKTAQHWYGRRLRASIRSGAPKGSLRSQPRGAASGSAAASGPPSVLSAGTVPQAAAMASTAAAPAGYRLSWDLAQGIGSSDPYATRPRSFRRGSGPPELAQFDQGPRPPLDGATGEA